MKGTYDIPDVRCCENVYGVNGTHDMCDVWCCHNAYGVHEAMTGTHDICEATWNCIYV